MNYQYPELIASKLWLESFRYCLTRRSHAVSELCENYRRCYDCIPETAKNIIEKELQGDIDNDRLVGDTCDQAEWKILNHWIKTNPKNC